MEQKSWKNQYIDLVETKPGYIIPCANNRISQEQIDEIQSRMECFENVFCELGSGSGMHLIEQAKLDRFSLYIGIELRFKRTFRTAEKAEAAGLTNLLVVRINANMISKIFLPGTLSGFYINFPDPWAKKRWLKHRMLNEKTLEVMHTLLKPDGFLSYKTDHEEYFDATRSLLESSPLLPIETISRNLHQSEFNSFNIQSEFEKLFISKGLPVFWLRSKKNS